MNSITIVGNLGQDPERRSYTTSEGEQPLAVLSVAVSKPPRGGQDQKPDWFDVKVFGRQAEPCLQYLEKGRTVAVRGRMESSTVAEEGTDRSRKYWNLVADQVEFIGGSSEGGQGGQAQAQAEPATAGAAAGDTGLPF